MRIGENGGKFFNFGMSIFRQFRQWQKTAGTAVRVPRVVAAAANRFLPPPIFRP